MFSIGDTELKERLLRDFDFHLQESKRHLLSKQK